MFSTIFHELGHALAAIRYLILFFDSYASIYNYTEIYRIHLFIFHREDMHIDGVGMMFILILPVAYVHLEDITSLPSSKQLRVMSAGVWHNIVQALTAYLVLWFLPYMLFPLFTVGHGIMVMKINQVIKYIFFLFLSFLIG